MDSPLFLRLYTELLRCFADPSVDEVLVNGERGLWSVAGRATRPGPTPFADQDTLMSWVQELARRHDLRLDPLSGSAGGSLEAHAYRWHCILPPLSPDGPLFSLRRHRFTKLTLKDFAASPAVLAQLAAVMEERCNLMLAGPTGCGKTTLLALLLQLYAAGERTILVEALAELPLPSPLSVRLLERRANLEGVGAVGLSRLVHEALRLRPDRLVLGEIRSLEAAAYLEAIMSGHGGVITTIHASSAADALARLSLLARQSGWQSPPTGWSGVPLVVVVLARGQPPRIHGLTHARFVPTA